MSKADWIRAHEQLVAEYLDLHPDADWTTAYERTADMASERAADNLADAIDAARDRAKYGE